MLYDHEGAHSNSKPRKMQSSVKFDFEYFMTLIKKDSTFKGIAGMCEINI